MTAEEKRFPYFLLVLAGMAGLVILFSLFLYGILQLFPPPRLGNFDDLRYILEPLYALVAILTLFLVSSLTRRVPIRILTILGGALILAIILVLRFFVWV